MTFNIVQKKLRDYICEESQDKGVSIDIDEWMDYIPEVSAYSLSHYQMLKSWPFDSTHPSN